MNLNIANILRQVYYSAHPPICMNVATWAKSYDLPVTKIYPKVLPEVEPYIEANPEALQEFETHYEALCNPQTLIAIEEAVIRDTVGLVQLPDNQICYQGNWWLPYLKEHPVYRRRFPKHRRRITGSVYSLLCLWGHEFYHWFHDVLPRLEFALPHLPSDTKFLIQDQPCAYQLASLEAYGIKLDNLEFQKIGMDTHVDCLWFATPIGHTSLGSSSALKAVGERMTKFFNVKGTATEFNGVYVSRKAAKTRRIVNEDELRLILHDYGFNIYTLEDLSFSEQVQLFSQAGAIAGPHGAGLMNMIYAPDKTPIVEISTPPTVPCYVVMAKQLQHPFVRIHANLVGDVNTSDMSVDPAKLQASLKRVLAE